MFFIFFIFIRFIVHVNGSKLRKKKKIPLLTNDQCNKLFQCLQLKIKLRKGRQHHFKHIVLYCV